MHPQNNEILTAWRSLDRRREEEGWSAIAIASPSNCELKAGIRFPGNGESLLVGFASASIPASEILPNANGFLMERVRIPNDRRNWLGLTRQPSGNIELFSAMVADVAQALNDEPEATEARQLAVLLRRVRAWQAFMRQGNQPLSAEAEVGFAGELLALMSMVKAGVDIHVAIEAWEGPLGGIHDFKIGSGALEVKSTLASLGFLAKIGSFEQLDDAQTSPIFVLAMRLRLEAASGANLCALVEKVMNFVDGDKAAQNRLLERLRTVGYSDAHSASYIRRFVLADMRVLKVDSVFPRLTRGSVPLGVLTGRYEIDLDRVESETWNFDSALGKLGAI